jgi:hypothetical protein
MRPPGAGVNRQKLSLRTGVGEVEVDVGHGQDPSDQHWGCPLRERWGLEARQKMSPLLRQKLAFTVTRAEKLVRLGRGSAQ